MQRHLKYYEPNECLSSQRGRPPLHLTAHGWMAFGRQSLDEVAMVGSHDGMSVFLKTVRET